MTENIEFYLDGNPVTELAHKEALFLARPGDVVQLDMYPFSVGRVFGQKENDQYVWNVTNAQVKAFPGAEGLELSAQAVKGVAVQLKIENEFGVIIEDPSYRTLLTQMTTGAVFNHEGKTVQITLRYLVLNTGVDSSYLIINCAHVK